MNKQNKENINKSYQHTIPETPFAFMRFIARRHWVWLFGVLCAVTVAEFASVSMSYIFKTLIDTANKMDAGSAVVSDVWFWALMYPVMVITLFLGWRISGFLGMEMASRSSATSYQVIFDYLLKHSHTYFSDRFAGSLSSKIGHASEGVQSLFEALMWNYIPSILGLLMTIVFLWTSDVTVAGIFIVLIFILIPLNIALARYRRPHVVKFSAQATKARGYAVDTITNIAAVRQYAHMKDEKREFNAHINEMRNLNIKQWRMSEWGLVLNNIIIVIFEGGILLTAVQLWSEHILTIGSLVMITTLMMNVQGTLVFIGMSMNGFVRRFGEIQEGLSDIVIPHEITDDVTAEALQVRKGEIACQDISFTYGENIVFKDFNLSVKPGERIGLVGASGAGKTTFVSLLLRQHELTSGNILIDGQDISKVTQDSLRRNIAVVPQEPLLFHRTIRENIIYGKPTATEHEIIEVAKKAQAHDFVVALNDQYETLVGERGVKLSGGQKQRIAIARAMLKDAPILILDEATSALDSESEVSIQKALHELMAGKTVIAIAHRLSTLREMDRIIVLESGKIAEDGSHDALVRKGGVYARLWKHQAGGFLQE